VTVLLVDDEPSDLDAARTALEKAGYLVFAVDSYESAIQIFQQHPRGIDIAVLDVSLPGKNGVDLYQDLLTRNPNLKALFVSGHVGSEVIRFYGLRATDRYFLKKPFEPAGLIARVREIIQSPEQLGMEDFKTAPHETRTANGA
jgi:two-component system, cell cycle sensor histidine kinase and response regulator CckA